MFLLFVKLFEWLLVTDRETYSTERESIKSSPPKVKSLPNYCYLDLSDRGEIITQQRTSGGSLTIVLLSHSGTALVDLLGRYYDSQTPFTVDSYLGIYLDK